MKTQLYYRVIDTKSVTKAVNKKPICNTDLYTNFLTYYRMPYKNIYLKNKKGFQHLIIIKDINKKLQLNFKKKQK